MKDVVIVANFVSGLDGKDNNRFSYLDEKLSSDCSVELISSDFYHTKKCKREGDYSFFSYKVTLLHEPGYPKNVCFQRFFSHRTFGKNVAKYLKSRKKPDIIYCAVPSLDAAKAASEYAHKNKIRLIIDIQDLWPEAFKMVFRLPVISDIIFAPMVHTANRIYSLADDIIAVSDTYCEHAAKVNKKCNNTHTVFLGTELSDFDDNVKRNKDKYIKPADELWLAYCGTLGTSYDLTCVFDALDIISKNGHTPPKFIIMGDGPRKEEFESYAKLKNINAVFTGMIPYDEMCAYLSACDIAVNPIVGSSNASIINKHADYAAGGLPVLNTQKSEEYKALVEKYNMGFNTASGDARDLADKLLRLMYDCELRKNMGRGARKCAEEKFDREKSYSEIYELIKK